MDDFDRVSQELASVLGERHGRTPSRVMGTGISNALDVTEEAGTDLAHLAMLIGMAVPEARAPIAFGLAVAFLSGRDTPVRRRAYASR